MAPVLAPLSGEEHAALREVWNAHQAGDLRIFTSPGRVLKALIARGSLHGWKTEDGRKYLMVTQEAIEECGLADWRRF
jgi:hypothetical protein